MVTAIKKKMKDETGSAIVFAMASTIVCIAFVVLMLNILLLQQNREEFQMAVDSATMGGAIAAGQGFSNADQSGDGVAIIVRSEAESKATEILKANVDNFRSDITLTRVRYNEKTADFEGKTLTPMDQYYAGYFTAYAEADAQPLNGDETIKLKSEATAKARVQH